MGERKLWIDPRKKTISDPAQVSYKSGVALKTKTEKGRKWSVG